jgi:hypothetical protein
MALAEASVDAAPEPGEGASRIVRWLCAAPESAAAAVAGFSLPTMLLLLVGHLDWAIAWPAGLLGAAVAVRVAGRSPEPASRELARWTGAAIGLLVVWAVVNMFFTAQDLFGHRDPNTYNLAGRWLVDHPNLRILTHPELFGSPAGYTDEAAGFSDSGHGVLAAQGNHLLPVLLGAVGRVLGTGGLLKLNVVFGALALLAFYAVARRVLGPRLALLVLAAFAVSMPVLYVSRDTFSEPLALLFLMGGLGLLHRAIRFGRPRDYGLAGFVAGCSAMVRIDAYAALLALIAVGAVLLARAPAGQRAGIGRRVATLGAAGLVPTVVGWVDVSALSPSYYADQRHAILQLAVGALLLTILGVVVVLAVWRTSLGPRLASMRWRQRLSRWVSWLVPAAFAFLASRPLWMTGHGPLTLYLIQVQRAAHVGVDATRSYDEQTVTWQALYFGPLTVLLAVGGYVLLLRRWLRERDWSQLGLLTMGLSMSALYLWTSQITPDQPWAARRYVPVVMPALLIAAAVAIAWIRPRWGSWGRRAAVIAAVVLVGYPLGVSIPAFAIREEVPQLRQVEAVCRRIGPSAAVVETDLGAGYGYGQTVRSYCGATSISLLDPSTAQLARMQASVLAQGRTLYVLATDPSRLPYSAETSDPPPFSQVDTARWPSTLYTTPVRAMHESVAVYLGTVNAAGRVVAITSGS